MLPDFRLEDARRKGARKGDAEGKLLKEALNSHRYDATPTIEHAASATGEGGQGQGLEWQIFAHAKPESGHL
ncbi:hypothetical protein Back2_00530 [Nocardioides baekrokdamisoli]|uniref:Uncharacterized protein n=1 Tax=Nocardioides baekrokdamisoli TaxID=1804624 RepID=A0A3G9IBV3_9ACTN|nr:hypothetical protein Back2_00530 [Nocardioides baekrokdamisoli]